MSSHEQESSHLFGDSTNDDPFSNLTSTQTPSVSEQAKTGNGSPADDTNDELVSSTRASPVNQPLTTNASADSLADQPHSSNDNSNSPQLEHQQQSAASASTLAQPYNSNDQDNNQEQQHDQITFDVSTDNQQQYYDGNEQQYDQSQWIEFDPNQHYYYDEQGGVHYYDPNTNQEYDMSQYYDENGQYQYDPQYAEYYAQQGYDPEADYTQQQEHISDAPSNDDAVTFAVPDQVSQHTPEQSNVGNSPQQGEFKTRTYESQSHTPVDEIKEVSSQDIHAPEEQEHPIAAEKDNTLHELGSETTDAAVEKDILDVGQDQAPQHQDADFAPLVVNAVEPQENQSLEFDDILVSKEDRDQSSKQDAEQKDKDQEEITTTVGLNDDKKEENQLLGQNVTTIADVVEQTSPEKKQKELPVGHANYVNEETQTEDDQLLEQSAVETVEENQLPDETVTTTNEETQTQSHELEANKDATEPALDTVVDKSEKGLKKQDKESESPETPVESTESKVEPTEEIQHNEQPTNEEKEEDQSHSEVQSQAEELSEQTQSEESIPKHTEQTSQLDTPAVIAFDDEKDKEHANISSFQSYEPQQTPNFQNPSNEDQQDNSNEAQQDSSYEPQQTFGHDAQQNTNLEAEKDEPQQDISYEFQQNIGFEPQQDGASKLEQTFNNDAQYISNPDTQQDSTRDIQQTPSYDHQQTTSIGAQETPSYDIQQTLGYEPQQATHLEHYEPQHATHYEPHQSTHFEPQQDASHDSQQNAGIQPQETSIYEPQQNATFEPQQTGTYERQENVSYEPQQAAPTENQQNLGYESQQATGYEPQQTTFPHTQPYGSNEPYQATNVNQHYYAGYYNQPESIERSATVPLPVVDRASSPRPQLVPCPDPLCEGENKPKAKFCCECGRPLMGVSRSTTPAATRSPGSFGFSPTTNPVDDMKAALKDSLDKFIPNSVILHQDRDIQEKRQMALDYINSRTSTFEDSKALLWNIVKLMLENPENKLGDGGALDRSIIQLIYTKEEDTVTITRLDELENILLEGDKEKACEYAKQHDMWGHCLVIASSIEDGELYKRIITEFIQRQLFSSTTKLVPQVSGDNKALRMLYSIFQGAGASSVDEFVKQRADEDPVYTAESLKGWKRALALILANRSKDDQYAIQGLGDHFNNTNEARLCYLLSPDVSGNKLLGKELDELYLIELYEFASGAMIQPHYKLILAWWLTELGFTEEPKVYCDSIANNTSITLESLKQLGDTTNQSENVTSLLSKATFDSLIGSIETKLSYGQPAGNESSSVTTSHMHYTGAADTTVPNTQPITLAHAQPISSPFNQTSGGWWDSNVAQTNETAAGNDYQQDAYTPESYQQDAYAPESYQPAVQSYQPDTYAPAQNYQPDTYTPAETNYNQSDTYTPAASYDDDDDLGFGNSKPKKVEKEPETTTKEEPVKEAEKEEHEHKGGWGLFSLFHRNKQPDSDEKKPVKANLGSSENTFYYDETLKKWVNKSAGSEPAAAAALPPPPKTSTPQPPVAPAVKPNSMPPPRVNSAPTVGGPPSVAPPSFNTPPVSSRRGAGGKKPMRSRYVDVLNPN